MKIKKKNNNKLKLTNKSGYVLYSVYAFGCRRKPRDVPMLVNSLLPIGLVLQLFNIYIIYISHIHKSNTINIVNIINMIHITINSQSLNYLGQFPKP